MDMSSIWPLSCYTYSKEVPCLPGFIEMSPQEVRFAAYTANALGNSSSFLESMGELEKKQNNVKHQYINITADEVRKLVWDNNYLYGCDVYSFY